MNAEAQKPNLRFVNVRTLNEFGDEGIMEQKLVGGALPRRRYEAGRLRVQKIDRVAAGQPRSTLVNLGQPIKLFLHEVWRHDPGSNCLFGQLEAQWRRVKPESKRVGINIQGFYALAFGLFLGLCTWKFGNPVILDYKISPPATLSDFLSDPWPTHWANVILVPLAAWGGWLILRCGKPAGQTGWPSKWLWILPLGWLGWQFVSASQTAYQDLATETLWQFGGCVACYFLGARLFARNQLTHWLLIGVLAAFAFCLVRAANQRLFEYPQNLQMLVEGERNGWTNFPPANVAQMKNEGIIVTTNGLDVASPAILTKFAKGRVSGTLVYPNALAEIILLLWPVSVVLAFQGTRKLRPIIRMAVIAMTLLLGGVAFFWTGSKLGWLIGIGLAGLVLLRLDWAKKLKFTAVAAVMVVGLGIFAVRFHHYFEAGATSAGARFDYWRAAVQTTVAQPLVGSGPGTFRIPYARLKAPESEMARLTHNDYLEQFSDSGIIGGLAYSAWIAMALASLGKKFWRSSDHFLFALYLGLLGWFAQGLGEFGLFVPALGWTAFTLLGGIIRPESRATQIIWIRQKNHGAILSPK